jgi:ribosomal-protein-alanine N-acetyltransferase
MAGTIEITTPRLVLRKFKLDDAEAMYKNWASDPEVTKYMVREPYTDIAQAEEEIKSAITRYETLPATTFEWCITLNGTPIGKCGSAYIDEKSKEIEFGFHLGSKWWGNGYATEAVKAIIGYWFSLGFNRIKATHLPNNTASGRVMQKCGLKYEGLIRQGGVFMDGTIHDVKQYAIIRSDWSQINANKQ